MLLVALHSVPAAAVDVKHVAGTATSPNPPASTSPASSSEAEVDGPLLLEVSVNGHSTGKIGEFSLRNGKLMTRAEELKDLGFRLPDSRLFGPGRMVSLTDVPGLHWTIDQKSQALFVTVGNRRLTPTILKVNGREITEGRRVIESGTGITLNYDVVDTIANSQTNASSALDLRGFSPWGILSQGWLGYAGRASSNTSTNKSVRLDSAYSFADVNTLRRYTAGDFVTSGLGWTRPVHVTGVQIRSDFSMRPDLVTFPLPSVGGSTAVPSTVDVLANGSLIASGQTGGGPFEVPQLPVISGAGTISMTVTNALGQQVTVNQSFYASSALLAPGLQSYAGQAGFVRRRWGTISNDYSDLTASAMYRRGLTPKFTVEGSGEMTPGVFMGGGGGVYQVGNLGTVTGSIAASGGSGLLGSQLSLGAQRIGRVFSAGASATIATRNYRDVAAVNGDGIERKQTSAFASLFLRKLGSAGLAYAQVDRDAPPNLVLLGITAEHSKIVSANYSFQIHRMSLYASEFMTFSNAGNNNGVQIGLRIPLGSRSSADISASSANTEQVHVEKSAVAIRDWGYDAYVATGASTHEFAQVQYKSPVGLFTLGADNSGGHATLRMESQGAISLVDKAVFPSNTIYDSFAVVDTGPLSHIHVFQENRAVGRTNASGRLLVPDLRSFDLNHLTIDSTDVPADVSLSDSALPVRPQDRSGVIVKFPIKVSYGALLTLVDAAGVDIPFGSLAKLQSTGVTVPVGYDGKAYVEDLGPHNKLFIERPNNRRCAVSFPYQPMPGAIPNIGPFVCVEARP